MTRKVGRKVAQLAELGRVLVVEAAAGLVDRFLELAARVVSVEAAEQIGCDLDLVLRRQLGVEHGGGPLLASAVDGRGEIGGDQGRQGG